MTLLEQLQKLMPLAAAATVAPWKSSGRDELMQKIYSTPLECEVAEYVDQDDSAFIVAARNLLTPENLKHLYACVKVIENSRPNV